MNPEPALTSRAFVATQESSLRIAITIDGQTLHATLTNSQANQDLIAQLPQTLAMR